MLDMEVNAHPHHRRNPLIPQVYYCPAKSLIPRDRGRGEGVPLQGTDRAHA